MTYPPPATSTVRDPLTPWSLPSWESSRPNCPSLSVLILPMTFSATAPFGYLRMSWRSAVISGKSVTIASATSGSTVRASTS